MNANDSGQEEEGQQSDKRTAQHSGIRTIASTTGPGMWRCVTIRRKNPAAERPAYINATFAERKATMAHKKSPSRFHETGFINNPAIPTFALAVLSSAESA